MSRLPTLPFVFAALIDLVLASPPGEYAAARAAEPAAATVPEATRAPTRVDPFVEHVAPPAVARGAVVRLELVGSQLDRATGLWTSLPPGKLRVANIVASAPDRTILEVAASPDCPIGLYALRLATEDGLSNPHLFVVDDLVPRETLADPQADFPVAVAGRLLSGGHERHRLTVTAGQRLTFDVVASRLGNDSDPLVTIFDSQGKRVARSDNSPGNFFDTSFSHEFAAAGNYVVEVRDARYQGSPHWRYLLRIGDFPAARVTLPSSAAPGALARLHLPEFPGLEVPVDVPALSTVGAAYVSLRRPGATVGAWAPLLVSSHLNVVESEPNDAVDEAVRIPALPALLHGVFASPSDRDHFACELKKGDRISVRAETKSIQSAADVELFVLDSTGREIQRSDDVNLPGGALDEASLQFTANQDGVFRLLVRELTRAGGPEFTYRLEVQRAAPRLQVTAEIAAFTTPRNSFQILPLNVVRQEYDGPIQLRLADAPAGLTLAPDVIPAGQNSLVATLRAADSTPLGVHSFHLFARPVDGESPAETQVVVQPLVDRQIINVDLIRYGLRDNQRYLPPSVRTEFALLVTPPAPFQLDAADSPVILPRYQVAELPLGLTREPGFQGLVAFAALSAGQLGEETQGRKQVFYRAPVAAADQSAARATFHSRSQANEGQERVDLYATAQLGERRITLNRSVQLSIKPAFELVLEPPQAVLAPGASATIRLNAKRLPSFAGPIQVALTAQPGVTAPAMLEIPAGQASVEFTVSAAPDVKPRRERIRCVATATVGGFQEEPRPVELDLEVKLPPPPAPAK